MKNLITKALGIAGITALSFLPLKSEGQTERDSTKFVIYGYNKDSVLEIKYITNPSSNIKQIKTMYHKDENEYYRIISKWKDDMDKSINKLKEENMNLFIYSKGYWTPGEYVYNKDLNLIRKSSK